MSLGFGFLWHAAVVYGSFRNCLINVITRIPMEWAPYNPYNYILWDFHSSSQNKKRWHDGVIWAFVAVVLCHDGNPSQGGHTVWEKYWWEEMDEKGILKAVAFEWGAGEDRYGGGVGASIWNLYSTPHNWWASRPTNLQILNLNGKLSPAKLHFTGTERSNIINHWRNNQIEENINLIK